MATTPAGKAHQDGIVSDAKESTTIKFEWTLRGLRTIFENSKGETKSKATKSPRFGDGRWQILFYANSGSFGSDGQAYVSLYLACEPTTAEKECSINGKWSREGLINFSFEIRNLSKMQQYSMKEAHDHSFHCPGAQNWGWAQFARRDTVYYQPPSVRQNDAFVIICSITSAPANGALVPTIPRHPIPKDLLDSMGSLLDDPLYSDAEFVLPQRGDTQSRKIYAARKLLRRVDYFDAMFSSGFAESALDVDVGLEASQPDDRSVSSVGASAQQFDDSDVEDEPETTTPDNDHDFPSDDLEVQDASPTKDDSRPAPVPTTSSKRISDEIPAYDDETNADNEESTRNTRAKLSHPSTPRSRELALERQEALIHPVPTQYMEIPTSRLQVDIPGPKKTRVVVRDVAYATYYAVLYYIYTDTIVFAPLSSSFLASSLPTVVTDGTTGVSTPAVLLSESQTNLPLGTRANQPNESAVASAAGGPRSRKGWIAEWERSNPGRPRPASAKSVYRLADRLELQDLKERAFRHFVKSLTVDNVVYEAFSAFSAAFEDVRKVAISYMFDHWSKVRKGAMLTIGQQLRLGRHPGFEEVWPAIIQHLAYQEEKVEGEPLL